MAKLTVFVLAAALVAVLGQECTDVTPDKELDCPALVGGLGGQLCSERWFLDGNYCMRSCGRNPCPAKSLDVQKGSVTLIGKRTGEKRSSGPPPASITLPAAPAPAPATPAAPEYPEPAQVSEPAPATVETPESTEPSAVETPEYAPAAGGTSEVPEVVEAPEATGVPATAEVTETPEVTETTEVPETPEVTETTEVPETAEVPEVAAEGCESVESIVARPEYSFLKEALERTGLLGSLSGFSGTVFAPTNPAFDTLLGLLELSKETFFGANQQVIEQLLRIHVIPGEIVAPDTNKQVSSLLGDTQMVKISGDQVTSPAGPTGNIVERIAACNAVVAKLDRVIIPRPVEGVTSG